MSTVKAADLPEGSKVDYDGEIWTATRWPEPGRWMTGGGWHAADDSEVDDMLNLDGAVVLRVGYGNGTD